MLQHVRLLLAIAWRNLARNPTRSFIASSGIAVGVGMGIAGYLALYQWGAVDSVWDPFFGDGSETVLDSSVSHRMRAWLLIPDAALGAIAYLGDAIYGLAGTTRRWQYRPWMVILFGVDVIPLGAVSVILVVLQGTVVGAFCSLCLASAVVSLIMMVSAVDEVWGCLSFLQRVYRASGRDRRTLWNVFWGRPSGLAESQALPPQRTHAQGVPA